MRQQLLVPAGARVLLFNRLSRTQSLPTSVRLPLPGAAYPIFMPAGERSAHDYCSGKAGVEGLTVEECLEGGQECHALFAERGEIAALAGERRRAAGQQQIAKIPSISAVIPLGGPCVVHLDCIGRRDRARIVGRKRIPLRVRQADEGATRCRSARERRPSLVCCRRREGSW